MKKTIALTPEKARKAELCAIYSSCCGFTGETVLTDSAVIILFAGSLGAGDMFSMIGTSLLPLFNGLLIIPMALMAHKNHDKRIILSSCILATIAYFLAASAPFWEEFAVFVLIASILSFALSLPGFIACWFPLLSTFIIKGKQTIFFSKMRFCHQMTAVVFLFVTGLLLGKEPAIWQLQTAIFIGAIIFMGRALFIVHIPNFEEHAKRSGDFKAAFRRAIKNSPLVNFSIYFFILNIASWGTIPLMTIYLKNKLDAPDNLIVIISGITLAGMLGGYLLANKLIKFLHMKATLYLIHISYIMINIIFFCIDSGSLMTYVIIASMLAVYSLMTAIASIILASGMLTLAKGKNKNIAMALCGAFYYSGSGLSRLLSSLLLGSNLLVFDYYLGSMHISHYQTLFLIYAIFLCISILWLKLKIFYCEL